MNIQIKRVRPDAILPQYATDGSAGMDLHACIEYDIAVRPADRYTIPTGIAIALPDGFEAQVRPRSGLAAKHGITVINAPGTVDADYRGEICVAIVNLDDRGPPHTIRPGDRIAQLIIAPVVRATWDEVESLDETVRASGGFGSTGVGAHD